MFRDLKSVGWEWERSRVWNPERANRLWLALAYAWTASLGAAAFSSDKAVKEVSGGGSRAARSALFRLGVDVFHLCLERGRRVVCSLLFPSGLGRAAKSVVQKAPTRGNRGGAQYGVTPEWSIPAHAGEPEKNGEPGEADAVYPRPRGGTSPAARR